MWFFYIIKAQFTLTSGGERAWEHGHKKLELLGRTKGHSEGTKSQVCGVHVSLIMSLVHIALTCPFIMFLRVSAPQGLAALLLSPVSNFFPRLFFYFNTPSLSMNFQSEILYWAQWNTYWVNWAESNGKIFATRSWPTELDTLLMSWLRESKIFPCQALSIGQIRSRIPFGIGRHFVGDIIWEQTKTTLLNNCLIWPAFL